LESPKEERDEAFAAIYERHSNNVLALCGWLLNDPDAAMAAVHDTFEDAFKDLSGLLPEGQPTLRDPDKLRAWLRGIATNRCRREWRHRDRETVFPDEDIEAADVEEAESRRRQAQVDRMLNVVAATFTEHQRWIYQLSLRQELRGQALAATMGVSEKEANDATYENKCRAWEGFGALVLARDGRSHCRRLAGILDQAIREGLWSARAEGDGDLADQAFTRVLRLRLLRHLGDCKTCDNCRTCDRQKQRLIKPYTPVLIPILVAAELRERVTQTIQNTAYSTPTFPDDPAPPPATPKTVTGTDSGGATLHLPGSAPSKRQRRRRKIAAAAITLLLLLGGILWTWRRDTTAVIPDASGASSTAPVQDTVGGSSTGRYRAGFHLTAELLNDPDAPATGGPEVYVAVTVTMQPANARPGTTIHVSLQSETHDPVVGFTPDGRSGCAPDAQHTGWGAGYRWTTRQDRSAQDLLNGIDLTGSLQVLLYPAAAGGVRGLPDGTPLEIPETAEITSHQESHVGCDDVVAETMNAEFVVPETGPASQGTFQMAPLGAPKIAQVWTVYGGQDEVPVPRSLASVGATAEGSLPVLTVHP